MESSIKLINPKFQLEFMEKTYEVRKANLDKAMQYQLRVKELSDSGDKNADLKLVGYCIYLVLKDEIPDLTEQMVVENTPADIDIIETLGTLGFMSPNKVGIAKKMEAVKQATS